MMIHLQNPWSEEYAPAEGLSSAPVTYRVQIDRDLSRMIEVYAAIQNISPEAAIAEAIRAHLGALQ